MYGVKDRKKVDIIQAHLNRNFKRWFKNYSGLQGVNVGIKTIEEKEVEGCISIVFHVNKKNNRVRKKVPKFLPVKINNTIQQIPTDVIEAGELITNGVKIGDQAKNNQSGMVGTVSSYFSGTQGMYVCSNMHVLGANLLDNKQLDYDARSGDSPQAVEIFDNLITAKARLIRGTYDGIDIAFAKIDNPKIPQIIEKTIKDAGPVNGFFRLTNGNFGNQKLSFFGSVSGTVNCTVISLGAVKPTRFNNIFLTNLIKFNRCTLDGDSGAAIYNQHRKIVGVIVGRDTINSYALQIEDVIQYFQDSNL